MLIYQQKEKVKQLEKHIKMNYFNINCFILVQQQVRVESFK